MNASDPSANASSPGVVQAAAPMAAERQRALARLRAVIVLALLLPALGFAAVALYLYRQELADARQRVDRAARIEQEHALKLFETNEMLLQRMLDLLGDAPETELLAHGASLHERLRRMAAELPQVQGLFINGADSRSLANSRVHPPPRDIDFSDREWYRAHRNGGAQVYVTQQIVSRITGEPAFDMSRRREFADGTFAGSVHVSLRPQYLTDFYRELDTAIAGLRTVVLRADGHVLARWPGEVSGEPVSPNTRLMQLMASGATAGVLPRQTRSRPHFREGGAASSRRAATATRLHYVVAGLQTRLRRHARLGQISSRRSRSPAPRMRTRRRTAPPSRRAGPRRRSRRGPPAPAPPNQSIAPGAASRR